MDAPSSAERAPHAAAKSAIADTLLTYEVYCNARAHAGIATTTFMGHFAVIPWAMARARGRDVRRRDAREGRVVLEMVLLVALVFASTLMLNTAAAIVIMGMELGLALLCRVRGRACTAGSSRAASRGASCSSRSSRQHRRASERCNRVAKAGRRDHGGCARSGRSRVERWIRSRRARRGRTARRRRCSAWAIDRGDRRVARSTPPIQRRISRGARTETSCPKTRR